MCSNYEPVTASDRLLAHFGVVRPRGVESPQYAGPTGVAPIILGAAGKTQLKEAHSALYGLLPDWAQDTGFGRSTYNCRSETVGEKPAFKDAWRKGQRCLIPVEGINEWCYETGEAVKWSIRRSDGLPMALAGIWNVWVSPAGEEVLSYSMLTVSAKGHAIFERMHAPDREKRMPIILPDEDQEAWLNGSWADAARFFVQFPADLLTAAPAAGPRKQPKAKPTRPDDMFADEWRQAAKAQPRTTRRPASPRKPPQSPPIQRRRMAISSAERRTVRARVDDR